MVIKIKIDEQDLTNKLLEILKFFANDKQNEITITVRTKSSYAKKINPMTLVEYNEKLETAKQSIEQGKGIEHEQAIEIIESLKK